MAECLSELNTGEIKCFLNGLALLSQLYWGPTPELCRELSDPALVEEVTGLSAVLGSDSSRAAQEMLDYLRGSKDPGCLHDEMESAYVTLFVNSHGGVAAPLYQSCYESGEGILMARPARMMQERLARAGIDLASQTSEPPDHLAVELEYLYLLVEQAYQLDDPSLLSDAREFAAQELLSWIKPFHSRIPQEATFRLYASATELLIYMIRLTAGCN
jgi:TorA maturation chaperone TorD